MTRLVPSALLVLALLPFPAAASDAITSYTQCVTLVKQNPALAEERALAWQNVGGGPAAVHCSALALTALKRYAEAGRKLDALARDRAIISLNNRAALFDEAGNAWMLANLPNNAVQSFSSALAETPNAVDALSDRARARAMLRDWNGAEADLSAALIQDQNRADLLVLRASARHALGHKTEAATDLLRALSLYPNYPAALVERGTMKYEAGDQKGARADWKKAAASPSGGEAAETAKRYLATLGPESKLIK
ncbi:MAG: hypothetical protein WCA81_03400 [Rhizomicrobium sp.]